MTTNWTVKLTQGNRELNLNSGRYQPDLGFVPPSVALTPLIATGTSANRYGGGDKVGERATDRVWEMTIRAKGLTDAEVARAGADLASFLSLASSDSTNPLYLEVRQNSDVGFDPLWGNYGTVKRFEIIHASPPATGRQYARGDLRAVRGMYRTRLMLKPYATSQEMVLSSALGGIEEDSRGWQDGFSRGLVVNPAATNKATNPVLGHSTYDNGYTTDASLISTENTDKAFVLFGESSVKLVSRAANQDFYQSLDVGNTNTHALEFFVKLPDGGVVSATQCSLTYVTNQTTTYTAFGDDGWYRLGYIGAGVTGGAQTTGIRVEDGYTVYADGLQIEERDFHTRVAYGDLMGNAWTGTAHASTTTRTAARARLKTADVMDVGQGTVRMVIRWAVDQDHSANMQLWSSDNSASLRAIYSAASNTIAFTDHVNSISTAALTFEPNTSDTFHFIYEPGSLVVYRNGVSVASGATYTPPTLGTYLYIASSDSATAQLMGTVQEFATLDRPLTAAEALADSTNIVKLTDDNQRVGTIPYLWDKDGDGVIDNCDDSTLNNWGAIGGIPGSVPIAPVLDITSSKSSSTYDSYVFVVGLNYADFSQPATPLWFMDFNTVTPDANACGDGHDSVSFSVTETPINTEVSNPELLQGDAHFFLRLKRAAGALTVNIRPSYLLAAPATGTAIEGEELSFSVRTSYSMFYLGKLLISNPSYIKKSLQRLSLGYTRSLPSGGPSSFEVDYLMVLNGPFLKLKAGPYTLDNAAIQGATAYNIDTTNGIEATIETVGDEIEIRPEILNLLYLSVTRGSDSDNLITDSHTVNSIIVTPRYEML